MYLNACLQFTDADIKTAEVAVTSYNWMLVPSVLLPVGALTLLYYWKNITHWASHPVAKKLALHTTPTLPTWVHVLREVNMDCLREALFLLHYVERKLHQRCKRLPKFAFCVQNGKSQL